jgi:protein involved in polysaccharide export with SLBB domain
MKITLRVPVLLIVGAACSLAAAAQRNNPFSSNPDSRSDKVATASPEVAQRSTIAGRTQQIAADSAKSSLRPTELYRVGVGDVLCVSLANEANGAGYYTVRGDGTIDFPLAGDSPLVEGKTLDEIETDLAGKITIFREPIVNAKVREYGSHKVNVNGLVERKGERSLQREALPLFVIKADAGVDPSATKVLIRRSDLSRPEVFDLSDPATDDVLIYPGYFIEFAAAQSGPKTAGTAYYYIAGEVASAGQKEFQAGMTLMQAILASGGGSTRAKKSFVRRKTDAGLLNVAEYDLKKVRDGKVPDPTIESGDMIEVVK